MAWYEITSIVRSASADRLRRVERQVEQSNSASCQPMRPRPDRAVAQVRRARLGRRVEVDVDDVVEHPHRQRHGVAQRRLVEASVDDVPRQVDRAEVADRRLVGAGVERDLGAQVRAVDDADVVLRRADVARILERDPRMPGLEEHRQHLPPQRGRRDGAVQVQLAARRTRLRTRGSAPRTRGRRVSCRSGASSGENSVHGPSASTRAS